MKRGIAVAAVLATGCLSVPPYQPEALVSYTETGTGGTAAGPGFALHFADGAGFHFPDALMIDGVDVMGHEPMPGCSMEDEVGFLISPTPRISAHGDAPPVTNRLVPVLRGPAVVKVKLEWETRFACNLDHTPGGTATFTVFPDGRIVRYDTIVAPSSPSLSASDCRCDDGGVDFAVSTFWTLARASFQQLYAPDPRALPVLMDPVIANQATSCIDGGAYQVAFAWRDSLGTTIRGGDKVIGFGRDLMVHSSILENIPWEDRSAIFIDHAGCTAATIARAEEYVTPSHLFINKGIENKDIEVSPSRDGIYGGGEDGDYVQPGVPVSGRVELTGTVKSSFAVWLRFPRSVDALHATRNGDVVQGPWYLPQRVDDRSWIMWFREPLSATQKITIDPS